MSFVALDVEAASAVEKYRVCWSRYVGWEPWGYLKESGILKKWAQRYGIEIDLVFFNDYIESINQFTAGAYIGCTMTNMDALNMPAASGVETIALITGDFSNGNDGVVLIGSKNFKDIKGRKVKIVQLSVSHYLLSRALEKNGMQERDLTLVNTSDADIESAFKTDRDPKGAVVTWNPMLMGVRNTPRAQLVFDSSQIPGEIIDLMVVRANAPDSLKKALVGAWYEAMQIMSRHDKTGESAVKFMAEKSGTTVAEFKAQLNTTRMFYRSNEAVAFVKSDSLKKTMDYVRKFSFTHGLLPKRSTSADYIGIFFPDGTMMGDPKNVKLRFDVTYMQMAAEGKLSR